MYAKSYMLLIKVTTIRRPLNFPLTRAILLATQRGYSRQRNRLFSSAECEAFCCLDLANAQRHRHCGLRMCSLWKSRRRWAFVPLPRDISCSFRGHRFSGTEDAGWGVDSVEGVSCRIKTGADSGHEKEIVLASIKVSDGLLATKAFGYLKLTMRGDDPRDGIAVAIGPPRLKSFREFLSRP